jgi:Domain of unknown function (DUF4118)
MRSTSGVQQTNSIGRLWFGELSTARRLRAQLEKSTALRYALAPVSIGVGLLVHLSPIGPFPHPNALFLACTVAAAWFGGAGPGFLAAILTTLVMPQLVPMRYQLTAGFFDLPRFLTFGIIGVAVGWGTTSRRRAEAALRRSELELRKAGVHAEQRIDNDEIWERVGNRVRRRGTGQSGP